MRVFGIDAAGAFDEYARLPFEAKHTEAMLEDWLESNPDGFGEKGSVLIMGRQLATDLGGSIDLLGLDRNGNVVVVELKRDRTPRDVIAQALEYAAFAEKLDVPELETVLRTYLGDNDISLVDYHREYFDLAKDEGVAFNKSQHLVIVGQQVTAPIRETAAYLGSRGILTTCVEFTFFEAEGGKRLFTRDVVVDGHGGGRRQAVSAPRHETNEAEFLNACDEHGRDLFPRVLDWAFKNNHKVSWGEKGFSIGLESKSGRVVLCYGYPRGAVYGQSIHTALRDRYGLGKLTAVPIEAIEELEGKVKAMGWFVKAGRQLKWVVDAQPEQEQTEALFTWLDAVSALVRKHDTAATPECAGRAPQGPSVSVGLRSTGSEKGKGCRFGASCAST